MNTNLDPRELALIVAQRANDFNSTPYQIGAVLADRWGIFSWGWCHRGNRSWLRSVHAERHAVERANPGRIKGATLYVVGRRRNSGRQILARPCPDCQLLIRDRGIYQVVYSNPHLTGRIGWGSMTYPTH